MTAEPQNENPQEPGPRPFQPSTEALMAILNQELSASTNNRIYLMATLRQLQQEFGEAQQMWQLERESLLQRIEQSSPTTDATD